MFKTFLTFSTSVLFSLIFYSSVCGLIEVGDTKINELPYCPPEASIQEKIANNLVFISTLDGRISALNGRDGGSLAWHIDTGPGQLLSSSIHKLELTNNGHWVRMIPSLSGGLYKFNGDTIDAIPVSADNLLRSSSFLFMEDLLIAGGNERRTYGVSVGSGKVLYECSMNGCQNITDYHGENEDIIVVRRITQTVRAVEARTGSERWNFSVGQHHLKYMKDYSAGCETSKIKPSKVDYVLKVIVPEGLICAFSKDLPHKLLWKFKFNSPIVSAWYMQNGELTDVDLFSGVQLPPGYIQQSFPSLYIGMHKKQLYIQESVILQETYHKFSITDESYRYPQIPWKPIPATSSVLGITGPTIEDESSSDTSATALSVLYASEYVNGNGFYLMSDKHICNKTEQNVTIDETSTEDNVEEPEETSVEIIIVSLWYWWKEVAIISFTTAILVNLVITQRILRFFQQTTEDKPNSQEPLPLHSSNQSSNSPGNQEICKDNSFQKICPDYHSRYLSDFDSVQCLGKGGFGVVFEAKNKIDDCHYAVKRITLPNKEESYERVKREVKALAMLEHPNIVRYFNAWVECPPPGWQEQHDQFHLSRLSTDAVSLDLSQVSDFETEDKNGNLPLSKITKFSNTFLTNYTNEDSLLPSGNDKSDSFIVFENSEETSKTEESIEKKTFSVVSVNSSGSQSCDTLSESFEKSKNSSRTRNSSLSITDNLMNPTMYLYIQMQLCHRESLKEWLRDNINNRDPKQAVLMFEQIVHAVEYVHMQGLIHRDLKPSNIFFSLDGQIKVGDFGLVTAMVESTFEQNTDTNDMHMVFPSMKHTAQVGTQLYMSPEQLKGKHYDYKVDIYSLGLILFELLVPFGTEMERARTLMNLRRKEFPFNFQKNFQQEFELLKLMLSHDPKERPTTYGIRARPPLSAQSPVDSDDQWHFKLPTKKRSAVRTVSFSSSNDS